MVTYLHFLLPYMPIGFPDLSILWFFFFEKKAFPMLLQLRGPLHCFISRLRLRILTKSIRWLSW